MKTDLLKRIVVDPKIFNGKPIIRGIRIKVETILSLLEKGVALEKILADYPDLEMEDIKACIAYARHLVANETLEEINIEAI
ncbi:MAG: DUF433 domain-containing protein [Bacillota bacterium]